MDLIPDVAGSVRLPVDVGSEDVGSEDVGSEDVGSELVGRADAGARGLANHDCSRLLELSAKLCAVTDERDRLRAELVELGYG